LQNDCWNVYKIGLFSLGKSTNVVDLIAWIAKQIYFNESNDENACMMLKIIKLYFSLLIDNTDST